MANINDYLEWRGDIPFNKNFPFNEIDSMILARFSYLLFDRIKLEKKETIKDISLKMKDFKNEEFLYNGDKELITNLGESKRFNNLIVTDYVKNNDKAREKQFGAITIHLPNRELYISYIGTDMTIYGWKEDFNMGFMENVPCQIAGLEYLKKITKKYPTKRIRIGGHSKGGNVAVFAAISSPLEIQKKIIKVYNYDGPGFNKKIIEKYENQKILEKIETYIPQDSIIGRVLYHNEKTTIVLSLEKGILEHDIFSWQVFKNDLIKLAKNTNMSETIDKTLTDWIENTTDIEREILVDSIFDLFYSTDSNTFMDLVSNLKDNIPKIMKRYSVIAPSEKKLIGEMIMRIVKAYMNIVKKENLDKIENIKSEYIKKGKSKLEELDEKYLRKIKTEFQKTINNEKERLKS